MENENKEIQEQTTNEINEIETKFVEVSNNEQTVEEKAQETPSKRKKKADEPKEYKALKGWSKFFFVLTCIVSGLFGASIALPLFLAIFGAFSAFLWIMFIIFGTIVTIGLMWTSGDIKAFIHGWQDFNDKVFNQSNVVIDAVTQALPIASIIGAVIILITWILVLVGVSKDKNRKKLYKGFIIALSILTTIYVVLALISIIQNGSQTTPTP